MRFEPLRIAGAALVRPEPYTDHRGLFARTWCADEYAAAGYASRIAQASLSFNARRGTLRGLHFQWPPSTEAKTVRCTRGALFDVLLDLRPASASYLLHETIELTADNRLAVHVPPGVAHGFQTLLDDTEVLYLMSEAYVAGLEGLVRWDDPAFAIGWPDAQRILSERDANAPYFSREAFEAQLHGHRQP
jgi:dTDP-4-dehydrorhamnose 3,5-epimerase